MLCVALSPGWWLAFDAQSCRIHKIWDGGVEFTGPVYDTRHGPQPAAIGDVMIEGRPAKLIENGESRDLTSRWLGYRFVNSQVVLRYELRDVEQTVANIELTPELTPAGRGEAKMTLTYQVSDLAAGRRINMPFVAHHRVKQMHGDAVITRKGADASIEIRSNGRHTYNLEFKP
jgi:cytochrome c